MPGSQKNRYLYILLTISNQAAYQSTTIVNNVFMINSSGYIGIKTRRNKNPPIRLEIVDSVQLGLLKEGKKGAGRGPGTNRE